ncbi:clathrin associated protein complex large subunit [Entomophthora muscae]|uniref:Clathrin associated protein complex large subunit n=1 Tax=Entomophthora muscae TaxID=34485 RepID=A0ACC2SSF8_9FUNG|nr:clathrin associated protein complex large subunit [Entomophthora muscae]
MLISNIVGLALGTLGNIASVEVARDLTDEVEKLLEHSSPYIRKKAALCAIRIIHKVPDLYEQYINRVPALISDKNHGVMLSGVTLTEELCQINEAIVAHFKQIVPILVRRLKSLATTSSFLPELDVNGVTDPFLQVKILKLLRILGINDSGVSETMADALAQVATNTDGSKNAGNSILYETVLTIMETESDSDLRALAINILGKFLTNKDNNTRYVALTTLNKAVYMDLPAVQRHRNTILECLQDADISIKRRALDLSFALIDESNIRILTRELLVFLESADQEFKQDTAIQICAAAEKYAPNRRWHIDTIIRVLNLAGNYVNEDIVSGLTRLISQATDLHAYSVKKLYSCLEQDAQQGFQESLALSAAWTIGELAHILIVAGGTSEEDSSQPSAEEVVGLLERVLSSKLAYSSPTVQQYVTTAMMKLTSRFAHLPHASSLNQRICAILHPFVRSTDVEVQQRVNEYMAILESGEIRVAVFEPMPATTTSDKSRISARVAKKRATTHRRHPSQATSHVPEADLLLDLMGDAEASPSPAPQSIPSVAQSSPQNLLADLLGGVDLTSGSTPSVTGLLDEVAPTTSKYTAYEKHGLLVDLDPRADASNPNIVNINATFTNKGTAPISNLSFQVAVPKSQRIQILPPSSTDVLVGTPATQVFRVANPSKVPIRLRIRVTFTSSGDNHEDIVEFSGFPDSLR